MTTTAQFCKTFVGPNRQTCGLLTTKRVAAGCIHEHVDSDPICDEHWRDMQAGNLRCPICWRSTDPHRCAVIGRLVP